MFSKFISLWRSPQPTTDLTQPAQSPPIEKDITEIVLDSLQASFSGHAPLEYEGFELVEAFPRITVVPNSRINRAAQAVLRPETDYRALLQNITDFKNSRADAPKALWDDLRAYPQKYLDEQIDDILRIEALLASTQLDKPVDEMTVEQKKDKAREIYSELEWTSEETQAFRSSIARKVSELTPEQKAEWLDAYQVVISSQAIKDLNRLNLVLIDERGHCVLNHITGDENALGAEEIIKISKGFVKRAFARSDFGLKAMELTHQGAVGDQTIELLAGLGLSNSGTEMNRTCFVTQKDFLIDVGMTTSLAHLEDPQSPLGVANYRRVVVIDRDSGEITEVKEYKKISIDWDVLAEKISQNGPLFRQEGRVSEKPSEAFITIKQFDERLKQTQVAHFFGLLSDDLTFVKPEGVAEILYRKITNPIEGFEPERGCIYLSAEDELDDLEAIVHGEKPFTFMGQYISVMDPAQRVEINGTGYFRIKFSIVPKF